MPSPDLSLHPHRRYNPLSQEWVLVSPQRTQRPWQGQSEPVVAARRPAYDQHCYLCPGNKRAGGQLNPDYEHTLVFDNDFPAILPETPLLEFEDGELIKAVTESGRCRVICYSPRHDVSVPDMDVSAVAHVVSLWADEFRHFVADDSIQYVQIFENKGSIMGCSNPHPHCQIWASGTVPVEVSREDQSQSEYYSKHGSLLLVDYLEKELSCAERVIYENKHFVALVPFWASWPFETIILPRSPIATIDNFDRTLEMSFADAYRQLTIIYDRVFDCEFPYSAGIHQAPADGQTHKHWQMHMHFYPPLLRSATVKKFMVGYEMLATKQRDITPEKAAKILRNAGLRSE